MMGTTKISIWVPTNDKVNFTNLQLNHIIWSCIYFINISNQQTFANLNLSMSLNKCGLAGQHLGQHCRRAVSLICKLSFYLFYIYFT